MPITIHMSNRRRRGDWVERAHDNHLYGVNPSKIEDLKTQERVLTVWWEEDRTDAPSQEWVVLPSHIPTRTRPIVDATQNDLYIVEALVTAAESFGYKIIDLPEEYC